MKRIMLLIIVFTLTITMNCYSKRKYDKGYYFFDDATYNFYAAVLPFRTSDLLKPDDDGVCAYDRIGKAGQYDDFLIFINYVNEYIRCQSGYIAEINDTNDERIKEVVLYWKTYFDWSEAIGSSCWAVGGGRYSYPIYTSCNTGTDHATSGYVYRPALVDVSYSKIWEISKEEWGRVFGTSAAWYIEEGGFQGNIVIPQKKEYVQTTEFNPYTNMREQSFNNTYHIPANWVKTVLSEKEIVYNSSTCQLNVTRINAGERISTFNNNKMNVIVETFASKRNLDEVKYDCLENDNDVMDITYDYQNKVGITFTSYNRLVVHNGIIVWYNYNTIKGVFDNNYKVWLQIKNSINVLY